MLEHEFCTNYQFIEQTFKEKWAEPIFTDLKLSLEIDLVQYEGNQIPFSINHKQLIELCRLMTRNEVCDHPFDYFRCRNTAVLYKKG